MSISLDTIAEFSWDFGNTFFLQTPEGNFVWSDPDYGGDNTIHRYNGSLIDFCKNRDLEYLRDKGSHRIGDYCGEEVQIMAYVE